MEKSIYRWVLSRSLKDQLVILMITILSFPLIYLLLEIPKTIVNDAIGGENFPRSTFGVDLEQIPFLLVLCGLFFALAVTNNVVKYWLNVLRARVGEKLLRALRLDLYQQVMRAGRRDQRRFSPGETVQTVAAEVEPLGGFVAEAFATPVFQGGTLAVYVTFIFAQDPFLGAAAISLYPIQAFLIPRLQKRVIRLTQQRVGNIRALSGEIAESVGSTSEIRSNGMTRWWAARIDRRLGANFDLRLMLARRKALIKFVNNVLNQITPFFFYALGGYAVIKGDIDIGSLVAVLAAYKDIAGPWKELLKYYQTQSDMSVRYQVVVEKFSGVEQQPRPWHFPKTGRKSLRGEMSFDRVSLTIDDDAPAFSNLNLTLKPGESVAIIATDSVVRDAFMDLSVRIVVPSEGAIRIGGEDIADWPEWTVAASVAQLRPGSQIFAGAMLDNLKTGLRRPPASGDDDPLAEDWVDYEQAGVDGEAGLRHRAVELAGGIGFADRLVETGLNSRLTEGSAPALVEAIIAARAEIRTAIEAQKGLRGIVEDWDAGTFNENAPLGENLLYAAHRSSDVPPMAWPEDATLQRMLKSHPVTDRLVAVGLKTAETLTSLIEGLADPALILKEFDLFRAEEAEEYASIVQKAQARGVKSLRRKERMRLVQLAFAYTPSRHRFGALDEAGEAEIVAARDSFRDLGGPDAAFSRLDAGAFAYALTIRDNLLFGKLRLDRKGRWRDLNRFVARHLETLTLNSEIAELGLDWMLDTGGGALPAPDRTRLLLLRALLRRPTALFMDGAVEATAGGEPLAPAARRTLADDAIFCYLASSEAEIDKSAFDRVLTLTQSGAGVVET